MTLHHIGMKIPANETFSIFTGASRDAGASPQKE
jgi:hypothetical protein